MRRGSRVAAQVRELGLIAVLGLAACSTRTKATESRGPFLSVTPRDGATAARRAVGPRSVSLALGGLPPEELPRLREQLAASTDTALRRAAPELFDFDGPADAAPPLRQALPDLPALTAAANLLGTPWEAPGISVQLVPLCEAGAARCERLFAPVAARPGDALVRRARGLAWALGSAALLRVAATSRPALLRALREAQSRPSSTLAMVFSATRGALDEGQLELLRQQARRMLGDLSPDAPQRPWLDALVAARADWELPIELDGDEVLVIPRLSALARLQDFASEIQRAGAFEWEARPAVAARP